MYYVSNNILIWVSIAIIVLFGIYLYRKSTVIEKDVHRLQHSIQEQHLLNNKIINHIRQPPLVNSLPLHAQRIIPESFPQSTPEVNPTQYENTVHETKSPEPVPEGVSSYPNTTFTKSTQPIIITGSNKPVFTENDLDKELECELKALLIQEVHEPSEDRPRVIEEVTIEEFPAKIVQHTIIEEVHEEETPLQQTTIIEEVHEEETPLQQTTVIEEVHDEETPLQPTTIIEEVHEEENSTQQTEID